MEVTDKPTTAAPTGNGAATTQPKLRREFGLWTATALVIGNMVGSGVFLLPASLALTAGPVSIFAWVLTGIGAMMLALVFAQLGRTYPRTGGPYVYVRRAFGDLMGFWTAWSYWINAWVGNAAIAIAFAGYLAVFWGDASTYWVATLLAIGLVWLMTAVNVAGVHQAARVQTVTTVIKFVPLLLIGVVGLFYIDTDNFTPFTLTHGFDWGISSAALLTLWAFIGLESATVPADEVKDPETTIPRATILGTGAATAMYLVDREAFSGVNFVRSTVIATLALAYSSWAIWGAGFKPVTEGTMLLLAGFPVFIYVKWRASRDAPTAPAELRTAGGEAAAAGSAASR
jgi:APA family basic amino acid/polyamine antiporter